MTTDPLSAETLAEGERLEQLGPPGPYRVGRKLRRTLYQEAKTTGPSDSDRFIALYDDVDEAAYTVWLRNHAPQLIGEIKALRAQLAAVTAERDALREVADVVRDIIDDVEPDMSEDAQYSMWHLLADRLAALDRAKGGE